MNIRNKSETKIIYKIILFVLMDETQNGGRDWVHKKYWILQNNFNLLLEWVILKRKRLKIN